MEQFGSIFFVIGLLVVMSYAWQRFDEPSFPQRENLPHTVDPLRYLFLRSTYGKARWAYVAGLIGLYGLLVAPGPTVIGALGNVGFKDFPPKAWALLIALVLTGVGAAPASVKWLNVGCGAGCTVGSWCRTASYGRSACSRMRATTRP